MGVIIIQCLNKQGISLLQLLPGDVDDLLHFRESTPCV